jgi:hypothetical protein
MSEPDADQGIRVTSWIIAGLWVLLGIAAFLMLPMMAMMNSMNSV